MDGFNINYDNNPEPVLFEESDRRFLLINPSDRLVGSDWTNIHSKLENHNWIYAYKPVSLEKTIKNVSPFEEDKITKEYMSKYGIDKVRGGSYVEVELSESHIDVLQMEIWGAKDLCYQCGRPGHFVKDCYASKDVSGKKIEYEESSEEEDDEWECEYCDKTFTTEFGCIVHERSCKGKSVKTHYLKQRTSKEEGVCYRCGRSGHYSSDCYATKHAKGYYID